VKFTYVDPRIAALVTQRIGAGFVEENSKGRTALAKASNNFLESELEESRRHLEAQEHRVELFRQQHGKELPTQLQSNMEAIRGKQMQAQALVESIARDRDRKLMLEALYREASSERPIISAQPTPTATSADPATLQRAAPRHNASSPLPKPTWPRFSRATPRTISMSSGRAERWLSSRSRLKPRRSKRHRTAPRPRPRPHQQ
jgi:hypothetical protein